MGPPSDAPMHMEVDPAWQWGFGILHFVVAGLVVFSAARGPVRARDWRELAFRMTILFSGAMGAVIFEGAIDRGGNLWYAEDGAWPLVEYWGVHVPLWVAPVYLWFIGGGSLWIIQRIRAGSRPRDFLVIFGGIAVADLLLEIPIIKIAKLYTYYGDTQPFYSQDWFPLPLWFITTNRVFDLVPALLILVLMTASKSKWIILAIPPVMWGSMYVSYGFVTWPVISALQTGGSELETHLAATYTIVLGLATTFAGAHLAPKLRDFMRHHDRDVREAAAKAESLQQEKVTSPA